MPFPGTIVDWDWWINKVSIQTCPLWHHYGSWVAERNSNPKCIAKNMQKDILAQDSQCSQHLTWPSSASCIFNIVYWECHHPNWLSYFSGGCHTKIGIDQHQIKKNYIHIPIKFDLPSGKLTVGPWFYHQFLEETHLPTPIYQGLC